MKDIKFCKSCLAMSSRPRISFDNNGICNACLWAKKKKNLDWDARENELLELLDKSKKRNRPYDIIVPVSGGKDGSYVSYMLRNKYNVRPLCVTITPPLELQLGKENLKRFIDSGYDHLSVNINPKTLQMVNKGGLSDHGFPYFGWLVAIITAVVRIAEQFDIELIMYGEDAEMEYGGTSEKSCSSTFGIDYMKRVGFEDGYEKVFNKLDLNMNDLYWLTFPNSSFKPKFAHWSYFENWDPYRNYLVAKENCGLEESISTNLGTFTNFSQNDQALYALHTYVMYLKYGFGRANQDACIEIRRGAMSREQAINLVKLYDGKFPKEFLPQYLNYFELSENEFFDILYKFANKDILQKKNDEWQLIKEII